ncbi:MAG TPA: sulfate adenylyltransferase subunit CysN [Chitinophagales bacterium]|nr:sulfate adenylyltransferase subunit CysN [Chitinophagales bacterium]
MSNPQSEIPNPKFNASNYLNMELLRFTTAGSVDDGKSTLIGRLLYDSKSIYEDQYESVKATSERRGEQVVNLALLTDGLKAEREQGITIDVAYRYFSTPKRKFIIADTPGHIQYTRNMVTGASTANLAIILIDARHGVVEQTRRHSIIASLLGIPHIAVCINKMDLVGWSQEVFDKISDDYREFATRLKAKDIHFIPVSALLGDNIVQRSENMKWYEGVTLMYLLETIHIASDINHIDMRFPVQYVIRPYLDKFHDYRGYAGRIASGVVRPGDTVQVLPSGFSTKIKAVELDGKQLTEAFAPLSVTVLLEDDIDISRGDMLVRENNLPRDGQNIEAMVCWMGDKPLQLNGKYALKHTTKDVRAVVKEIKYRLDINTLHRLTENPTIGMNDIGRISLRTTAPLFFDSYTRNRETGSFILIDEATNVTVGAAMIID